jgi:hypothetical protein
MRTTGVLIVPLPDPNDYDYMSAVLSEEGIALTRPLFTKTLNRKQVMDHFLKALPIPEPLKSKHKMVTMEAKAMQAIETDVGKIPSYTVFYRFPSDFQGSTQFFCDPERVAGTLIPYPIHVDTTGGPYGHRGGDTSNPITLADVYAVAYLFTEKQLTEDGDEKEPEAAPRNLNEDLVKRTQKMQL